MKALFLPGSGKTAFRVYYHAVVQKVHLGTMTDTNDVAVVLSYDREHALVLALIAREMEMKGISPELFFELRDPGDVVVLFKLPNPSTELIQKIIPQRTSRAYKVATKNGAELVATGESEFEFESLVKYLLPVFEGTRSATLIVENSSSEILVTLPIKKVVKGFPPNS